MVLRPFVALGFLLTLVPAAPADGPGQPILRVEGDGRGPIAQVTALAFSPDGKTLYATGYDKVVRFWTWDAAAKRFTPGTFAYRVPIGPGLGGVLNALAVSPDGRWLAATGIGVTSGDAGFDEQGRIYPDDARSSSIQQDRATVFLFDTDSFRPPAKDPKMLALRGPAGVGVALAFAPARAGKATLLVSATRNHETKTGQLCLWDVSQADARDGGKVAEVNLTGLEESRQPSLAVRHTGAKPDQVRVGVAWSDGVFRLWDAESGDLKKGDGDGLATWNNTVANLPDTDRWLTGGFDGKAGYFRTWSEGEKLGRGDANPVKDADYAALVPRGLAPLPAAPGGGDRAAATFLAVRKTKLDRQFFQLRIITVPGLQTLGFVDLWDRGGSDPVLAAAPDGSRVAVAGAGEAGIRVYDADDVIAQQSRAKPQTLAGTGTPFRSLGFVRKGGRLGLRLSPSPAVSLGQSGEFAKEDVVFDPTRRAVVRDPAAQGWESADARKDGWSLRPPDAAKKQEVFRWTGPDGKGGDWKPRLKPNEQVTAAVLLPPARGNTVPLVAVASWNSERGEPLLAIYDARTGNRLRELFGHVQRVHALAASPDGRFLASTGEDQTVSLWGLTDIDKILNRHGTIDGLRLEHDAESKALLLKSDGPGGLKAGDRILGIALAENADPIEDLIPFALYEKLWDARPGSTAWLHVRRKDGKREKVPIKVAQGVDEYKPLLTLFLAGKKGELPEWIAWTPTGLYDAGGREIEQYVGWHFNPTGPGKAVQFAKIEQYRGSFHEQQLLPLLLEHASLEGVREAINQIKTIAPPRATLQVNAPGMETTAENEPLVRDARVEVRLTVTAPSLKDGHVESAKLLVGDREVPFDLAADAVGQTLSRVITLDGRGRHTIKAVVKTKNPDHEPARVEVNVRRQAPRPTIVVDDPTNPRKVLDAVAVVYDKDFPLRAHVPESARITSLEIDGNKIEKKYKSEAVEKIGLSDGKTTTIRLEAVPSDAGPNDEPFEKAERTLRVVFQPKDSPRPLFTELELGTGRRVTVEQGKTAIVDTRQLRLLGIVTAPEKLMRVELRDDRGARLALPQPDGDTFDLKREVKLEDRPGEAQSFVLEAETRNSRPKKVELKIAYRPPLPSLEVTGLPDKHQEDKGRAGSAEVPVQAVINNINPQADFHPFDVLIRVINPKLPGKAEPVVKTFTKRPADDDAVDLGKVRIGPGENRVVVSVRNPWRDEHEVGTPTTIIYQRPPFILDLKFTDPGEKPFTDVTAEVDTPTDLPLTQVVLNGRAYPLDGVTASKKDVPGRKVTVWSLKIKEVALGTMGSNPLTLEVRNAEGEAARDVVVPLKYDFQARPADVEVLSASRVEEAQYRLELRVHSASKLRRVGLRKPDETLSRPLDVSGQKEDLKSRRYEFTAAVPIDLREGTNLLAIEAENDRGVETRKATITYIPRPVRLLFERPDEVVTADEISLNGRIVWTDARRYEDIETHLRELRVFVNGFRQGAPTRPRVAGPRPVPRAGARELAFTVKTVLNRNENAIQVDVPGLPLEAGGRMLFKVACAKPRPLDVLRVVLVNAGERQIGEEKLVEQAKAALARLGPFRNTVYYPSAAGRVVPLSGYVRRAQVPFLLEQVQREAGANDLVLIYWVGREGGYQGEQYLLTGDSVNHAAAEWPSRALPLKTLLNPGALGGRIVLLDTVAVDGTTPENPDSPAALLRRTWPAKGVTAPGLLAALEKMGKGEAGATLWDLARVARQADASPPPAVTHNLKEDLHIAEVPLTGGR